jgi:hypothetical protein
VSQNTKYENYSKHHFIANVKFVSFEDNSLMGYCAVGDGPDDEDSTYLWNVSLLLPNYTAQYPRRLSSSYSPP